MFYRCLIRWLIMGGLTSLSGCRCMDQYNPAPYRQKLTQERETANTPIPKLTETGEIPKAVDTGKNTAAVNPIDAKYTNFCSSCHGPDGKADTAMGKALNPKPRNFTLATWQDSVNDERIAKVVKEGGASVGLSPLMAPWGALLNEAEIKDMVKKIREFKGK